MGPVMRLMFRAPIALYGMRLGWVMTKRMLLLEHRGRKSGLPRKTVLEVVEARQGVPVIASGFGEKSDWIRNIEADPDVTVMWGVERFPATARRLTPAEAAEVFERYRTAHPRAAKMLGARLGLAVADDPVRAGEQIPAFRLEPVT